VFNLDRSLQTHLGGNTNAFQKHVELTKGAQKRLRELRGGGSAFAAATATGSRLADLRMK